MEELYCIISGPKKGWTVIKAENGELGWKAPSEMEMQEYKYASWMREKFGKKTRIKRVRPTEWR